MRISLRLRVLDDAGVRFFGPGGHDLLAGVARTGSLAAAAREAGLSYPKAQRIVQRLEEALAGQVLIRQRGGNEHGGSALTPLGSAFVERFARWQASVTQAAAAEFAAIFGDLEGPPGPVAGDDGRPSVPEGEGP